MSLSAVGTTVVRESSRDPYVAVLPEHLNTSHLTKRQRFLRAVRCGAVDRPPVWFMRQAGRVLPEYRALKENHSFLELVQTPELAAEVTLQPVRRFNFDAAILFSDILVVPEAMGQAYHFRDTGGVQMEFAIRSAEDVEKLDDSGLVERLQYVAQAIRLIKPALAGRTALLGFAGSPWTLANFMLDGGSAKQHTRALSLFRENRALFDLLCAKLTRAVIQFLRMQVGAGVDALQIFDSHGGLLPAEDYEAASGKWIRQIVAELDGRVPVILFAKGARNWDALIGTGAQALGVDWEISLGEARRCLPERTGIQGNLDPAVLVHGTPETVAAETKRLADQMRGRDGYIFNLGHGVPPAARLENIASVIHTLEHCV